MTGARDRLGELMTAARLRLDVREYALRVLDALGHPPLRSAEDPNAARTVSVGTDPIRVLVLGAGLAIGYGVRRRADAFDGPLVDRIAATTGRGVVLDNRAVQHLSLSRTADSLGLAGTHTFHVAVWCPSFSDGLERLRLTSWRHHLHDLIDALGAADQTPLLLTHMPVPAGLHPAALIARPWVHRINRVIDQVASEYDRVHSVPTEPFVPAEVGEPVTSPAYFEAVADRIAPAVLAIIGYPAPTGPASARSPDSALASVSGPRRPRPERLGGSR